MKKGRFRGLVWDIPLMNGAMSVIEKDSHKRGG